MIICTWHPNVSNLLGLINETKEWTMNIIDEIFIHYKMNVKTSISDGIWFDVLWLNICIVGEDFVPTPASLFSFLESQAHKVLVFKRHERSGVGLKTWVGRISCRCGTKVSSPKGENPNLPRHLKTKILQAWLPKEDNKLAGVETKSSPTVLKFKFLKIKILK